MKSKIRLIVAAVAVCTVAFTSLVVSGQTKRTASLAAPRATAAVTLATGTEVPANGAVVHLGPEPGTFSLVFFYSISSAGIYEMQTSTDLVNYTPIQVFDFSALPPLPPEFKLQITHTVSDTAIGPWSRLMRR